MKLYHPYLDLHQNPMRYLIILVGLSIFGAGCSQKTEAPKLAQKTLSGIYEHFIENHHEDYIRFDLRTDGTVVYKQKIIIPLSSDAVQTLSLDGKGNYAIQGDKVLVEVANTLIISNPLKTDDPILQTNVTIFRIDGDDLIHLVDIVDGEKTNFDNDETRYIKQR